MSSAIRCSWAATENRATVPAAPPPSVIKYQSSVPGDGLADFRDQSLWRSEPPCFEDGV